MTLSERQSTLAVRADAVAAAARRARAWVEDARRNAQSVANEAEALIAEARRTESLARKLSRSAGRRMCVGVYGASQQGKSYLVSVLARPPGKSELRARFGAETRDFVREINPQGGKESTGLVTRFSTEPSGAEMDAAHPVELLLLTELDFVKILANSFQSDFDQNNVRAPVPQGAAVRAVLAAAAASRQPRTLAPHLDDIALSDLSEYFQKNFRNRWQELEPLRYWTQIIDLAPALPLPARAALFSVLWGGIEEFTTLYVLLVGALERLGHAAEAVTQMRALIPRATSIIDVATLEQQLGTRADEQDLLSVRPRGADGLGAPVDLPRATLTALIAELRITLDERPWPMFEHTELLDFPGARSRLKLTELPPDADDRARQVRQLLLRGKIAYLFQRYAEERELTAMLLCMGNKQNEVKDLGTLVRQWIELTHGATPAARRAVPGALFLVLTMMDLEFLPKAGETEDAIATKWDVRLHASLIEPFQQDGWVADFAGRPFDATVMLRNPNFKQDHLIEYELAPGSDQPREPLNEVGIAQRNRGYIEALERSFMASAAVARHVADPRAAWDAIFAFNDGGVRHIVEKLGAVSNPDLKLTQVEQRLAEGAGPLAAALKRFHTGTDEQARREKEALLRELRRALQGAFAPRQFRQFPRFLEHLMVAERDVREIALNAGALRIDEIAAAPAAAAEEDIFAAAPAPQASAARPQHDRAALFAQELLRHWIGQLRRLPLEEAVLRHFALKGAAVSDVADQLVIAAERLGLADRIAAAVRAATDLAALRWDDVADRIVAVALYRLNAFVAELGYADVPPAQRPGFPEGSDTPQRHIFAPQPDPGDGLPALGDQPAGFERDRFVDWGIGFLGLGIANLSFGGGREVTEAQNLALGAILRDLAAGGWAPS
ncbi:MAG: virulence factor [Proteobacteria bacterium]|nr:virulence factor [Pseudomonadota bacterium]